MLKNRKYLKYIIAIFDRPKLSANPANKDSIRSRYIKLSVFRKRQTTRAAKPLKIAVKRVLYMAYVGGAQRSLETVKGEDLNRECPDCGSTDIEYKNEEFYCKKCGLVLD